MSGFQKFSFDRSFDAPEPTDLEPIIEEMQAACDNFIEEGALTPPPPVPTYTEDDLLAARTQAYAEGETAGRSMAIAGIEQQTLDLMSRVETSLGEAVESQKISDLQIRRETAKLAHTMVKKLFPTMAQRHGLSEVEGLIDRLLTDLLDEPRLIIKVGPDQMGSVQEHLDPLAKQLGYEGTLVYRPEPGFGPLDCRIEWARGGAERISPNILQDIDDAVVAYTEDASEAA